MSETKSIVRQLQAEALNPEISISDLLRKAKVVSVKLDLKDFLEWINNELNGYMGKNSDELPSYRIVSGEIKAWNPYHGWLPVHFEDPKTARSLSRRAVAQPIAEIEDIVKEKTGSHLFINYSPETKHEIMKAINFEADVSCRVSRNVIVGILEAVRNLILDWSLRLEQEGILGENLTFSKEELERALEARTIYNISNIEKFTGNIGDISGNAKVMINEVHAESKEELQNLLKQMKRYIPQIDLEDAHRKDLEDKLIELDTEIKTGKPNTSKTKKILSSIRNILEGAAGNVIAQGIIIGIEKIIG